MPLVLQDKTIRSECPLTQQPPSQVEFVLAKLPVSGEVCLLKECCKFTSRSRPHSQQVEDMP